MDVSGKIVVVTGGANGIGAALVSKFIDSGATVVVFDILPPEDGEHIDCDVSDQTALGTAIDRVQSSLGAIDIFVSNAGVMSKNSGAMLDASDADWARCWSVNVMAQVYAARLLLPSMVSRGSGYFVNVASAAGLLNQIGDAPYSATKHAAVSFAESLAISHRADGIGVSVVCPQYVATAMIGVTDDLEAHRGSLMTAQDVAHCIVEAVERESFLVLPHPEVAKFAQFRAADHDRWLRGMSDLRQRAVNRFGDAHPQRFYRLV